MSGKETLAMSQMTIKARESGKPKYFVILCYNEASKERSRKLIKEQFPMRKWKNNNKITYNNTLLKHKVSSGKIQGRTIKSVIIDDNPPWID